MTQEREFQSTHPHGVRHRRTPCQSPASRFNPRTRTGCDSASSISGSKICTFQSTHPHGVRPRSTIIIPPKTSVSIHAPARGATELNHDGTGHLGFNPRTRTGCDAITSSSAPVSSVSIHAPARGATYRRCVCRTCATFQSTHPHGVRPGLYFPTRN